MVTGPGRRSSSSCAVAGTVTAAVTSAAAAPRAARGAAVGSLRLLGFRQFEVGGVAVHERLAPGAGAVLVDAVVPRRGVLGRVADGPASLPLPLAGGVGLDEPELPGERRGGDRPAVT